MQLAVGVPRVNVVPTSCAAAAAANNHANKNTNRVMTRSSCCRLKVALPCNERGRAQCAASARRCCDGRVKVCCNHAARRSERAPRRPDDTHARSRRNGAHNAQPVFDSLTIMLRILLALASLGILAGCATTRSQEDKTCYHLHEAVETDI